MGTPGTPPNPQVSEPLSAPGAALSQPSHHLGQGWQGAAAPEVFAQLLGPHAPGLICSPCFQLPFQRQQQICFPPAGTQSCWRQRQQYPPTPGTQGLMLIKRSTSADN